MSIEPIDLFPAGPLPNPHKVERQFNPSHKRDALKVTSSC
jgi:hypothetical protein